MTSLNTALISVVSIILLLSMAVWVLWRERSRADVFLCAALIVTALFELFDLCALTSGANAIFWKRCALFAEAFLPPFWILCSLTYARQSGPWKIGRAHRLLIVVTSLFWIAPAIFPVSAFYYAPDFPDERILFLGTTGFFYYVGIMASLVLALVNFEVTLANASHDAFWKVKFEIIGFGTILAVLTFYFSQALLYRTLNMNYLPLRSFMIIVAVTMVAYSHWRRRGKVQIQVSRQVAFKSFVLFAVGIYLIMLGLLGEGMKYIGDSFPRIISIVFAFLIGVALLILLLSERFKREVKVVLHKNFYQNKHDYRTQWLRFTEQLSNPKSGEELQQRILSAYCDIFGIGGAALFLYEEEQGGYCVAASYEMAPAYRVISPDNSLVRFMKESAWVVNVKDDNAEIVGENHRFFEENSISFIIPLFDGQRLEGFITLGRIIKSNEVYIYEDYDLMKTIARQASQAILHQRLSEQIIQVREMEAIGNVATFVLHDLKNLVTTLSLIVDNAARYMQNPDFQKDMLASLGNTIEKMQTLIGRLKNLGDKNALNLQPLNLLELVTSAAETVAGSQVAIKGVPVNIRVDGEEIQKVVLNLLINAIEASGEGEPVLVEVGTAGKPFVRVSDRGCGMSDHYIRTSLFKPFKTTKKQGIGIGLYQCRKIVEGHGGWIEVSSEEGNGSIFTIWFPDHTMIEA